MKYQIYVSYFYQIRFFHENMVPVSTAIWDPKWFHDNKEQSHKFLDKNGVWNGFRATEMIMSAKQLQSIQKNGYMCNKNCSIPTTECGYLKAYRSFLNSLDLQQTLYKYEKILDKLNKIHPFKEKPIILLMVHESPSSRCSERVILQEWFADHGIKLLEWRKSIGG